MHGEQEIACQAQQLVCCNELVITKSAKSAAAPAADFAAALLTSALAS
jgi:hypothetical protein